MREALITRRLIPRTGMPAITPGRSPDDDKLLGTTSFSKLHWPGNDIQDDAAGTPNDATLQREMAANTLLRGLGSPMDLSAIRGGLREWHSAAAN